MPGRHASDGRGRQRHPSSGAGWRRFTELNAVAFAAASLVAAGIAATVRLLTPFEHGTWLVGYLVLVGFAAQVLLAWGQVAVLRSPPPRTTRLRQTALWNLGVVAVPLGVLVDARLPLLIGSICLLAALTGYLRAWLSADRGRVAVSARLRYGYATLLGLLGTSVFVGAALGWDRPWV